MTLNEMSPTPYGSAAHAGVAARFSPPGIPAGAIAAMGPGGLPELCKQEDDPPPTKAAIYAEIRFGPFRLRPALRQLFEADRCIRIGGRGVDLLIALIERAGEIVEKDELIARAWPKVTVCEGNLKTQIAALRRALRDGLDGARYVTSIPGRGYCFVAPTIRSNAPRSVASLEPPRAPSVRATPAIGRAGVVKELVERLQRRRFVTIVGPTGVGKTTTALAVAAALEASSKHSACLVDLSRLAEPSLMEALASALGVATGDGDPAERVIALLRDGQRLIVLDCCDRVVDAAAVLAERIIKSSPGVAVLATSQEGLCAEGETLYRLPPLETAPDIVGLTAAEALAYPATQLFVERAAAIDDFALSDADAPVAADICRRLDGLPLAIELAARHVHALGACGVAAALRDRLHLRMRGRRTAQERHQTLGAALDWSCRSLSELERVVLRRLSSFAGAFTLDAACAVGAAEAGVPAGEVVEIVARLVAKSLLHADVKTVPSRYRMLQTTRSYIQEKATANIETPNGAGGCGEYVGGRIGTPAAVHCGI
jgi:predicted ATPase/DNA-binding winged helix-turn-helix (wHTH) protein